jgi:hypothetical protein
MDRRQRFGETENNNQGVELVCRGESSANNGLMAHFGLYLRMFIRFIYFPDFPVISSGLEKSNRMTTNCG